MSCFKKEQALTPEEAARQKKIESQLRNDKKKYSNEIKLLLLGAGESGKTTILKQMKIIHLKGYTDAELRGFVDIIQMNIIHSIQALISACENLKIPLSPETEALVPNVQQDDLYSDIVLTKELAEIIKKIWADNGIQKAFSRAKEFQLMDSAGYFLKDVVKYVEFTPSYEDVLRSRAKTSGISEIEFTYDNCYFKMVDVGGQRSERKKWIHCFQDVTAVIFVVALSEYDQTLFEDEDVNRMHESIKLFDEICNGRWFRSTSIILFLNKSDLFKDKIQRVDLSVCFSEYNDGNNYDKAITFIKSKFERLNKVSEDKHLYIHVTCATDTENIRYVFNCVKDILFNSQVKTAGV